MQVRNNKTEYSQLHHKSHFMAVEKNYSEQLIQHGPFSKIQNEFLLFFYLKNKAIDVDLVDQTLVVVFWG